MWPGDPRLCVLQREPFVVLPDHAHWRQLTWAPPTAVPIPGQTSLVRGSEMPGPWEGWPVLSRPIPMSGSPELPKLPWGGRGEPGATDQLYGAAILAICRSPSLGRGPRAVGAVQPVGEGQLASGVGTMWMGEVQGGDECVWRAASQQGAP